MAKPKSDGRLPLTSVHDFPPMGRRSKGSVQAFNRTMWGEVSGRYRATWNENVVLILMIETLEGVQNAREVAKIPGVDGLFAASGDLSAAERPKETRRDH